MDRGGHDDDGVPVEVLVVAAQVRVRAAQAPSEEQVRALGAQALTTPGLDMTAEQIKALTDHAADQARQVSHLLTRLADLLGDAGGDDR